jgi:hypothetical protein
MKSLKRYLLFAVVFGLCTVFVRSAFTNGSKPVRGIDVIVKPGDHPNRIAATPTPTPKPKPTPKPTPKPKPKSKAETTIRKGHSNAVNN